MNRREIPISLSSEGQWLPFKGATRLLCFDFAIPPFMALYRSFLFRGNGVKFRDSPPKNSH